MKDVWTVKKLPISLSCAPKTKDINMYNHLTDITIPEIDSDEVMLLIGSDSEAQYTLETRIPENTDQPFAELTVLGWVVRGKSCKINNNETSVCTNFLERNDDILQQRLERMWKTDFSDMIRSEKIGRSVEDNIAEKLMQESISLKDGQYELSLPWNPKCNSLPNNKALAQARLMYLKKKLDNDVQLHTKYTTQMNDYLEKGYAEEVKENTEEVHNATQPRQIWYLPHHAVTNPNKPDKVRVVLMELRNFRTFH